MNRMYMKNTKLLFMLLLLSFSLTACAGRQDTTALSPLPPVSKAEKTKQKEQEIVVDDISYAESKKEQYVVVHTLMELKDETQNHETEELAKILEMEGVKDTEDTAVMRMRPQAIKEAAQLITFQTAMEWRYKQLITATEKHSAIMDTAFNFTPLLMTHGDTLIMPPVLTKAGSSMRIEESETVTTAKTTYELLEPARYVSTVPNWRIFLMVGGFPKPEKPNPALLPQNAEEREIWREAVREAWEQGIQEADMLYVDNVASMTRTYRGIMLYHLLTAQHLLSHVNIASADMGLHISDEGNKLHIGQNVYRITAPSRFTPRSKDGK